ncbi:hypothetical protein [uncultured Sutterella sp.]|uniref:hypothetical protein n=1 Tax=uncultured Sutterella sp. TaxID=286133 RepID=UPI0025E2420D|nr:hypothetical protein [uncultured Sutterella sp.]
MPELFAIETPEDYIRALAAVDPILFRSLEHVPLEMTPEDEWADEMVVRIEAWENKTFPHKLMTGAEAVAIWAKLEGLTAEALGAAAGVPQAGGEILAGARELTPGEMKGLMTNLGLPWSVFMWPVGWSARRVEAVMERKAEGAAGAAH